MRRSRTDEASDLSDDGAQLPGTTEPAARRREIVMFIILAVLIWPILTVAIVGGYGFAVWMSQIIAGPPGPPPV
jgi:periplasmic nitrate reductase NapE